MEWSLHRPLKATIRKGGFHPAETQLQSVRAPELQSNGSRAPELPGQNPARSEKLATVFLINKLKFTKGNAHSIHTCVQLKNIEKFYLFG